MGHTARMPSRRWMWVRPTPHIYAYNRELSAYGGVSSSSATSSETSRSMRASSEAAFDRTSVSRTARASSLAPAPGTSLAGYTGYYGRQLAMMKEADQHRSLDAAASKTSATASRSAVAASSAASKSVSASMKSTSIKQTVERQETNVERSLEEGRRSMSRAVRRAEYHAETSGKDPRHVGVPRNVSDDICKNF